MRSLLLCLTTSLDGFIADSEEGIDWILPPPDDLPQDYLDLMDSVDTLVMGRSTYELSLAIPGGLEIFRDKQVYVFTSRTDFEQQVGEIFVSEKAETFITRLKEEEGGTIWLFGGGMLATALSDAGLIDEYLIVLQPILLGEGIPLWRGAKHRHSLELVQSRIWPGGMVELRYQLKADSDVRDSSVVTTSIQ
jgi:dihydrofolate reductase